MFKHVSLPDWLRQALIYSLALALAKAVSLLMIPVFTHYLEPEDFAKLDLLQSLADILSIVIGLGLADTLYRYSGASKTDEERKQHAASILGLAVMTALFFGLVLQLVAPIIQSLMPLSLDLWDIRIILISLSFSAIILVPLSWLRMESRPWSFFSASAGRALFQAGLAFFLLSIGFGITGALFAGMIACISLASFAFYTQWKVTGISLSLKTNRSYGGYAGPLILVGLFGFILGSFDRWIIAGQGDSIMASHYALAVKFALATAFLVQPYEMWWLPKRFSTLNGSNGNELCARFAMIGIGIAFLASILISAFSPLAITIMTPDIYHGAIAYVGPLALLSALHMSNTMINLGILTGNHTRLPMKIDGVAAAIALIGYLILIPNHGVWGAIMATAIALLARFIATFYCAQKTYPLPFSYPLIATVIGIAVFGICVIYWLNNPWVNAGLGIAIALLGGLALLARKKGLGSPAKFALKLP